MPLCSWQPIGAQRRRVSGFLPLASHQDWSTGIGRLRAPERVGAASTKWWISRLGGDLRGEKSPLNAPKSKNPSESIVLLGPLVKESALPPLALEPNANLEAALDRLLEGIRRGRGG
jgi:hypothetical protein